MIIVSSQYGLVIPSQRVLVPNCVRYGYNSLKKDSSAVCVARDTHVSAFIRVSVCVCNT